MGTTSKSASVLSYRRFATISALISVAMSLMVLAGWWLHIPAFTGVLPGLITMKPNTAVCFLLIGIAIFLLRAPIKKSVSTHLAELWVARGCALLAAAIGAGSFVERVFGYDFGIDLLLFHGTLLATNIPTPGLMAAAAGAGFFLMGMALLLVDWETRNGQRPAQWLAIISIVIGLVALLSYIYSVTDLFGPTGHTGLALHTALIFMLQGAGILSIRSASGTMAVITSSGLGSLMSRRLFPIIVVFSVTIGWLRLKGQNAGYYGTEFGLAIFAASNIVILAIVLLFGAIWLNRADLARRRAEERDLELAAIVASSSDAIVGKTLDGIITSWNSGAERLYGYTEAEVVGQHISILVPPTHIEDVSVFLAQIRRGIPIERFETTRWRKDRALLEVSLTISPIHDKDGTVIGASTMARDITERKQFEERLRQSQAQLKGIIDSAMDAVITVNKSQNIVMFNASAEKMFGYSATEAVGLPLSELIPENLRLRHSEHLREFASTGVTSRAMADLGAISALHKDGTEFPIEASISQVDVGGNKFFTAIVRDITERVRSDRALREQASVLNLAQVLVRDMEDRIVLWNTGAEKLYGFTLNEALGRTSHELLKTVFPEPLEEIQKKLISTGEWEGELVHTKRDGARIVVASVWTLEHHSNGQPWRILEVNTDITGRKRAEEAMQLAQARLLSALEGGRMSTWVWDVGKKQIDWDDSMTALLGRNAKEMADGSLEPLFSCVHQHDRARARSDIENILREGTHYDSEYRIVRPDKTEIWIASRGRVERDAQGHPFRIIGIFIDITDRKKMEAQLLQSQKMESLGTLAGGIAHDFNNILLAIGGNASLAIEELPMEHPAQLSLSEIAKASARASNMVRQILAFSRRQTVDRKRIAVQPVVEEALALLRATLPMRIEIRASFAPDLPAILADSTQIHQVIMNLGTNAARAIGEHAGLLEVVAKPIVVTPEFAASQPRLRPGDYAQLSVSDNGCGMDSATKGRIFDPFFTTQEPGKGTGLGLSVVHGIMKDHDAVIAVYSEPGKGTVFHLYFPAAGATNGAPAAATAPLQGHGEHLLYVDDEEALVLLATRSLTKFGYKVTGQSNPAQAVQIFKENPSQFAAIVTDLSMPGMSGIELAREIFAIRPDIPVVMTSGYILPADEAEARKIGIREMILKPDTIEELAKALHRVFSNAEAAQ